MRYSPLQYLFLVAGVSLLARMAPAHHSFATHFDLRGEIVIVGELTEISLRNPHSYFTVLVSDANGDQQEWEVETQSLAILGRSGISNDTLSLGDQVVMRGMPSLDPQKRFMFAQQITPPGRGAIAAASYLRLSNQRLPDNRSAITGVERLTGKWLAINRFQQTIASSPLPLNEAGRAAHERYETLSASAADCVAPNLPAILAAPYIYEISLDGDRVIFSHEYNDIVRDVVPGADEPATTHPEFGSRTGRYADGQLTVTTTDFPELTAGLASSWEPNGNGADVPSSEQKVFTEHYTVNEDGSALRVEYELADPVYMTEPFISYQDFIRVPFNTPVYEFNCDAEIARRSIEHAVR